MDRTYRSSDDRLADYATAFNFVEVDNACYQVPPLEEVKSWRTRVPQEFQFAVRCNHQITHHFPFATTENHFQMMDKMEEICKTLGAVALVLQTPARYTPSAEHLQRSEEFLSHYKNFACDLVWGPRGSAWNQGAVKEKLRKILSTHKITHCADISWETPLYSANLSYTRIFGLGVKRELEFSDLEIKTLHTRALELPRNTYITFYTQRRTVDAARLKVFDETGQLIKPNPPRTPKYVTRHLIK